MVADLEAELERSGTHTAVSRAQLELALVSAHTGTWEWDIHTNNVVWSNGVEALFGLAPGTFGGTYAAYMNLLDASDRRAVERAIANTLATGQPYSIEHPIQTPKGVRWLGARGQLLRDETGKPLRLTGVVADVTERKLAEVRLVESEERLRAFAEAAFEGIAFTSRGVIIDANRAICRLLAYDVGELVGMRVIDLVVPEDMELVRSHISTGYEGSYQHRIIRRDGSIAHVEARGRMVTYKGQLARITALRDITERIRLTREREQLEQQLLQAQKMEAVGQLAGGIAHDFNNILSVILGNLELAIDDMKRGADSKNALESLGEAMQSARKAADVTSQLLAFSRRLPSHPHAVELNALIRDMKGMLLHSVRENIKLTLDLAEEIGVVVVDPGQIQQVVMNLVVNARDAMPHGGEITLSTSSVGASDWSEVEGRHSGYVKLEVKDTGTGMDAATLARIFEPFYSTKPVGQGTGLGLSMAYGIVDQAGGRISAASEVGRGTVMSLLLPCEDVTAGPTPIERAPTALPRGRGYVLICEDERNVRSLMRRILEGSGYRVFEAEDGEKAMELARTETSIDLVITDVILPGMDGKEVAARVRAVHPGARTLYCSGYASNVISERGILQNDVHFLAKPFTRAGLLTRVKDLLALE